MYFFLHFIVLLLLAHALFPMLLSLVVFSDVVHGPLTRRLPLYEIVGGYVEAAVKSYCGAQS
jgi:hypothetical protein